MKSITEKIADVVVVVGSIAGSTLTASNLGYNNIGYVFFILASLATLYLLSLCNASKSLYVVNGYFLIINVVGVIRY